MKIETSIGEIVDKCTILEIKRERIKDPEKLKNIEDEHSYLRQIVFKELNVDQEDFETLKNINSSLWEIEEAIRNKERTQSFDQEFITLARLVYYNNDKRASVKKNINQKYGSKFVEEKSYANYNYVEAK